MKASLRRRDFLRSAALTGAGLWVAGAPGALARHAANEKLNLAVIGTGNRAREDLAGVARENIVALCDVDQTFLAAARQRFPRARTYADFRRMLEQKDIDAVVIATADHTHAVAIAAALRLGKHVYCEKPLTHTVHETRAIATLAAKHKKLATQMGTQIHAGDNYRRVVEWIQAGTIGSVRECHVWCDRSLPGGGRPTELPPVPETLDWELWLGPAPARPYHSAYVPKTWRRWWAFGEGTLGDFGCHYLDLAFWALGLRHPLTVEAEGPPVHPETVPPWLIVHYEFPARGAGPPVRLTWYDGGKRPALVAEGQVPNWRNGVLFVGDNGMVLADYSRRKLLPDDKVAGFQPPPQTIPDSIGHHEEWIQACKTGGPTTCHFDYAAALTETVLLGNVAYRLGQKLEWEAARATARNSRQALNYLRTEYRKGWQL